MRKLTVGSLFSGIGGLEYGLEMTGGFETKWQVEIDEYATKILEKHWPDVTRFRDIRECGRQVESRLGGNFDGLSGGLDRHRWPARSGEQQYEWEPPRVVTEKTAYRTQRLKALGNAVVPQCAEYIGHRILASIQQESEMA